MLSLFDELFLLALDEEKGNYFPFVKKTIAYGLAGAILAELALQGKICSTEKHRLEVQDAAPTGDEILDETLKEIQSSDSARKLTYWISQLTDRPKKMRERLGEHLAARNMLFQEEKHFFRKGAETGENPAVPSRYELKQPLRAMILGDREVDHRGLALLSAIGASQLLNLVFTQDELEFAFRRIHEEILRSALEIPAMQTIEEIEQAVFNSLEDD